MSDLYHSSTEKDLRVISPQRTLSKDKYIGDFVFATADPAYSAMYLVPKGLKTLMHSSTDDRWIVICSDPEEFRRIDKGGAIYGLSSDGFIKSPQVELGETEMVCRKEAPILDKKVYSTALEALRKQGVAVYFAGESEFQEVLNMKSLIPVKLLQLFDSSGLE